MNGCIENNRTVIESCTNNPCGSHGECFMNSNNTFSCYCDRGYTGDKILTKKKKN